MRDTTPPSPRSSAGLLWGLGVVIVGFTAMAAFNAIRLYWSLHGTPITTFNAKPVSAELGQLLAAVSMTAMLVGAVLACVAFGQALKRRRPMELEPCTACGYELRGVKERRCPECGAEFWSRPESPERAGDLSETRRNRFRPLS